MRSTETPTPRLCGYENHSTLTQAGRPGSEESGGDDLYPQNRENVARIASNAKLSQPVRLWYSGHLVRNHGVDDSK
jgi:hypothetical protein